MIGKKLKQIRRDNKLTQEEFGKKLLHTKSTISKWENNQATPDIATLKKISDLFDIDINSLIKDMSTKRKTMKHEKPSFSWDKANYSGNRNLAGNSKKWIWNSILTVLTVAGLALMILPIAIRQNSYDVKDLILTCVGVLLVIFAFAGWMVILVRRNKEAFSVRNNIRFDLYSDKVVITSKKSGDAKKISMNSIRKIKPMGVRKEMQIEIHLENDEKISLFNVDNSVYETIIKFKKGSENE